MDLTHPWLVPLVRASRRRALSGTARGLPRAVEAPIALMGLVALLPLFLVIALAIAMTSRGPVLFRHTRVGRRGQPFALLKFRSMRPGLGGPAVTAKADPRVTPAGRLLRKTKLDELPELWNVVRGDMSLVGPRPESVHYVNLDSQEWQEVLSARPGITDPVTLRLRNEEELLAAAGQDYETFYRDRLLPYKLRGYREYLAERTWRSDVAVLSLTLLAIVLPSRTPAPSPADIVATHS